MVFPRVLKGLNLALLSLLLLAGCGKTPARSEPVALEDSIGEEIGALSEETDQLTLWTVYWDTVGKASVLRQAGDAADQIVLFAADYQEDQPVIPDATLRFLERLRSVDGMAEKKVYLSVVNDLTTGGKSSLKDTDLLHRLLDTDASAKAQAKTLAALAKDNGFDGIEIDFEKIRKDLPLWERFFYFEACLLEEAEKSGLEVRILLEPGTPVDKLVFPEGPQYVLMCYNLYGGGTGPGPKADADFLRELYDKFRDMPNLSFALANGGYHWAGSDASQLRAEEAVKLAADRGCTPQRDPESCAMFFFYQEGGKKHTVWYADDQTLCFWAQTLQEAAGAPVDISLWRI